METSIYKRYKELKEKHPDAIILFRSGDFYEIYEDDAVICNKLLGVPLEKRIVMRGSTGVPKVKAKFPCNALDTNLSKLVRAGHRVAICDLLETPTNKLVKRWS